MLLWCNGDRKLVVHHHIFKNAGTSIDFLLERAFPSWENWTAGATAYLGPSDLAAHLADREVAALSSHTLRPGAPAGYDVFPIILIRHPLDRAYSVYLHERRCAPNVLSCHVARVTDFKGYVEWCIDHPSAGGIVIANYQTAHLSTPPWRGHVYNAVLGEPDLIRATTLLDSLPVAGTVDRFRSFVARLRPALATWLGRPVAMPPMAWENWGGEPRIPLGARVAGLARELGPDLQARFEAANGYDARLYDHAVALVGGQDACEDVEVERPRAMAAL